MRVLMVQKFHYRRGGDSTYMFSLSSLLEERGHEIVHFAMDHPENLPSPWSDHFVSEVDFPALMESRSPASAWKVMTRSIYSGEARRRIAALAEETKPDIAHFHNIHGHLTTSIIEPLRKRSIPIVWTCHDYVLVCPNSTFLSHGRLCERCLPARYWNAPLQRCKKGSLAASFIAMLVSSWDRMTGVPGKIGRFIAPSAFLCGKLIEGGIDGGRIEVIPNFIDLGRRIEIAEGDYFLCLGRLSREKGLDLAIRAAGGIEGARLLVVGEGPDRGALEREAAEHGGGRVELIGYVTGEELERMIAAARFVVVPSRWYENLPYSVMEAMSAGKPVVASDIGGIPEMVDDGVTGLLFPHEDMYAMREHMKRLNSDEGLRRVMGDRAREKAERLYGRDAHYESIMKVYEDVLGGRGEGSGP
jgi:glycosyltransferase involved in cell wall biosynthesis